MIVSRTICCSPPTPWRHCVTVVVWYVVSVCRLSTPGNVPFHLFCNVIKKTSIWSYAKIVKLYFLLSPPPYSLTHTCPNKSKTEYTAFTFVEGVHFYVDQTASSIETLKTLSVLFIFYNATGCLWRGTDWNPMRLGRGSLIVRLHPWSRLRDHFFAVSHWNGGGPSHVSTSLPKSQEVGERGSLIVRLHPWSILRDHFFAVSHWKGGGQSHVSTSLPKSQEVGERGSLYKAALGFCMTS